MLRVQMNAQALEGSVDGQLTVVERSRSRSRGPDAGCVDVVADGRQRQRKSGCGKKKKKRGHRRVRLAHGRGGCSFHT